ncbi:MAG: M28 family peptidase [Maribacter sp.]
MTFSFGCSQKSADIVRLEKHLTTITKSTSFRNHANLEELNRVANYIESEFQKTADSTKFQDFVVNGNTYRNVIASFGTNNKQRIIVGAHYDVAGNQEGADDNASGVVGLIELSRLLKNETLNYQIDLVAYSLEEPPYFRTENMGSYIHAKSLITDKIDVKGMVSLEMIGYFKSKPNTQFYPDQRLSEVYGTTGDFISLVGRTNKKQFAEDFSTQFKNTNMLKSIVFDGPASTEGVDFSDHLNYWNFDISALMITDTAFLRNPNYHNKTDTMKTLDLEKMTLVINVVHQTLLKL